MHRAYRLWIEWLWITRQAADTKTTRSYGPTRYSYSTRSNNNYLFQYCMLYNVRPRPGNRGSADLGPISDQSESNIKLIFYHSSLKMRHHSTFCQNHTFSITITCNTSWPQITAQLKYRGQTPFHRPDTHCQLSYSSFCISNQTLAKQQNS